MALIKTASGYVDAPAYVKTGAGYVLASEYVKTDAGYVLASGDTIFTSGGSGCLARPVPERSARDHRAIHGRRGWFREDAGRWNCFGKLGLQRYKRHVGRSLERTGILPLTTPKKSLQTPGAGIAAQLEGGRYSRAYIGNVAIGARDVATLMTGYPLANLWACVFRLCEISRAEGYVPEVMFYSAEGEADAALGTTEQAFYDIAVEYYGRAQLFAAQAMRNQSYVAPVVLTYAAEQGQTTANLGENDRNIKEAIRRLCVDQPGFIDGGAIYQWPVGSDRVHPDPGSYVLRGEHVGRLLKIKTSGSDPSIPLRIVDVTLSGTTFVVTFSKPVLRDTTLNVGQNLNTALAEDGLEWFDNGTAVAIVGGSLVYSGNTITGTLASAPAGTLAQQVLRIAEQYTSGTLTAGATNLSGSVVYSTDAPWTANYGATLIRDFAIPQRFKSVRAP